MGPKPKPKKPYISPKLQAYGSFRQLTKFPATKAGTFSDGAGVPKTKASGSA